MGFISELRKIGSKHQSSSKTSKEDKLKSNGVGSAISRDLNYKAQKVAGSKSYNHESVKGNAVGKDELVKHMTNLPGYLWRTDGEENVRGKALNVGVLDWTRLEKWKHKHMNAPAFGTNFTSFSVRESPSRMVPKSFVSAGRNDKLADQRSFLSSSIKASYKEGFPQNSKQSFQNAKKSHHSKSESVGIIDGQNVTPSAFETFSRSHREISFEKAKRKHSDKITLQMENLALNSQNQEISQVPKRNLQALQGYGLKKNGQIRESTSGMGFTSLKPQGEAVSFHYKKEMSVCNSEVKKAVDRSLKSDIKPSNINHKPCRNKPSNCLLQPPETPQSSYPQVHQSRMSFDEDVSESTQGRRSNVSIIDEVYSEHVNSEIPYSCPLPRVAEPDPTTKLVEHRSNVDQDICHPTIGSKTMYSLQFEGAYNEKNALDDDLKNHCVYNNSNKSRDQGTAEQIAQRGRNSSPNRRFSFSLGRIGRSFSFKEGSSLPQYSSTYVSVKSGPVSSESSDCLDNSSTEKVRSHRRTGSSPFRRILGPILKHKATEMRQSAERSQATKGTIDTINFKTNSVKEPISHAEKSEGSSVQALLHLTLKNGVPIFKFVLNNERKILAATIKRVASPEKDDSGCFTFYLVDEVMKKSGGWMSHRSKDKSCRYVYNAIAQMKSSSSKNTKQSSKSFKMHCFVKEFVLLSVEIGQKDQITPKFIPSQELAAVVVEIPCGNCSQEVDDNINFLKNECLECLAEDRCSCSSRENDVPNRTTVILPGGIHGSPSKGEPSPLIYRWKTGGLCDCGGWDIGCKLLVLSNHKERSIITRSSKSHPRRFQLFVQEGDEQSRPLFSLMPLKDGFFSVEFSSSITHLQAFFVAVSLLNCQKEIASEMNKFQASKELSSKNNDGLQGKEPLKYTPIPPLSPVGRV